MRAFVFCASILFYGSDASLTNDSAMSKNGITFWIDKMQVKGKSVSVGYSLRHKSEGSTLLLKNAFVKVRCAFYDKDNRLVGRRDAASLIDDGFMDGRNRVFATTVSFDIVPEAVFLRLEIGEGIEVETKSIQFQKYLK